MATIGPRVCDPTSDDSRKALITNISRYSDNVERPAKPLVEMIAEVKRYNTWPKELKGEPKTWERFCTEVLKRPAGWFDDLEHGVSLLSGASVQDALTIGAKVAEARETKEKQQGKKPTSINLIEVKPNSNGAVLRRLARDCPEMLDKIEAGELSVNAAAIAAGIRKKPTPEEIVVKTFAKVEERLETLRSIIQTLAPHEALVVRGWLNEVIDT